VDAIADLVGGPHAAAALPALRPGGQIASIATPELDLSHELPLSAAARAHQILESGHPGGKFVLSVAS